MALVSSGFVGKVSLVDNGGNTSTKTYNLRAIDNATALTDMAAILIALQAVTNSVVSSYQVAEVWKEDAFNYPVQGIENEDKASLTVLLTGAGQKKANIKIPAPVIAMFNNASGPGANVVNTANVALVAYTDLFKAAAEAYISDGEDLSSLLSGKRISARNNNG